MFKLLFSIWIMMKLGRGATQKIMMIARRNYQCFDNHPMNFKDVNDELIHKSLLSSTDL
jgi:hypothetical protein